MIPIKKVWYEVRYQEPFNFGSKVLIRHEVKSFFNRKSAQKFFDKLSDEHNKLLVLCEESVCDAVYSKN